jgi:hypothetical protein
MSFWYDPRTRQPQIWTYPIFIGITFAVIWGFFFYGGKKAEEKASQKIEEPRKF